MYVTSIRYPENNRGRRNPDMKLIQLIEDIARIETELMRFEKKFGVRSPEFYRAITSGELEEFDTLDDYRMEFIEWLSLHKTLMSLDQSYRQLITRQPVAIQMKSVLAA
ncbi:MAG: hypothetical protein B6245_16575 [Desulfobacteraceae bacterium 4572_88]|nr:MAG: hypothetical protein B6245_16575 [Desulfobacteraceae bacterium 4572_88]